MNPQDYSTLNHYLCATLKYLSIDEMRDFNSLLLRFSQEVMEEIKRRTK